MVAAILAGNHSMREIRRTRKLRIKLNRIRAAEMDAAGLECVVANVTESTASHTILATAMVRIEHGERLSMPIRALCDSGSQLSLISADKVAQLGLPTVPAPATIVGVGGENRIEANRVTRVKLHHHSTVDCALWVSLVVVPRLGMLLPSRKTESLDMEQIKSLDLADPRFDIPDEIDLLLGADVWAAIILEDIKRFHGGLVAQSTRIGWAVFGKPFISAGCMSEDQEIKSDEMNERLDVLLQRFWAIEELPSTHPRTPAEDWCEKNFIETHRRAEGRYVVTIPINEAAGGLGQSRGTALARFNQLERRLARDDELRRKYVEFMDEYLRMGHMREAPGEPIGTSYYIPHHHVTRKFRVVFDASMQSSSGRSLNDIQYCGEKLQGDLFEILVRFRNYKVAMAADIEKMFRQVAVNESQYDLQRILWRRNTHEPIKEYQLLRVTYGTTSAGYNAVRAMHQCADDNASQFPLGANAIKKNFYVDDLLAGADDAMEAMELRRQIIKSLEAGGFPLRKWKSNDPWLRQMFSRDQTDGEVNLGDNDTTILGMIWLPATDQFGIKVGENVMERNPTKLTVIRDVAKLFDPIGMLAPFVVRGKILIQRTWKRGLDWKTPLPCDLRNAWEEIHNDIRLLQDIRIPRWTRNTSNAILHLVGFADASVEAYGAALYLRVEDGSGQTSCMLIAAKSKVAPVKALTIPRLELCAAKLLSDLLVSTRRALGYTAARTTLFSDSTIVLQWLAKLPCDLKTFVSNRVAHIQQTTEGCRWRHVCSADNAADIISRGASAREIREAYIWWHGPKWLLQPEDEWPSEVAAVTQKTREQMECEVKTKEANNQTGVIATEARLVNTIAQVENGSENGLFGGEGDARILLLERVSNLRRLLRITAYVKRIPVRARALFRREPTPNGPIGNEEQLEALDYWIKYEQSVHYAKELEWLKRDGNVSPKSDIKALSPIIRDGMIRLGGRLANANIPIDQKNPIILPPKSTLTRLMIEDAHRETQHGGIQLVMQYIRQRYWVPDLRRKTQWVVQRCLNCVRQVLKPMDQLMGELPDRRVNPARAFQFSGVDFFGPVTIKARNGRGNVSEKGYVAVFICLVTRAIHLEPVVGLSVGPFLAAFARFTSRRGKCSELYSDNGTTFVGSKNEMRRAAESWRHKLMKEGLAEHGVIWKFITKRAPHQGGIWEAAVKSVKHHMKRMLETEPFSYEALYTLLTRVEACVNSRPICRPSDDASDQLALTPAHFLIGEPLIRPLDRDCSTIPTNRLDLWNTIVKREQEFWKQFQRDVYPGLQIRKKWCQRKPNLQVGDVVVIKEDNLPPGVWKMARVVEAKPGKDGLVRTVILEVPKKQSGDVSRPIRIRRPKRFSRAVQKLCPIPVDSPGVLYPFVIEPPVAQGGEDVRTRP